MVIERQWKELDNFSRYKFSSCGEVYDKVTRKLRNKTKTGRPRYYYVHLVPDDTGVRSLFRLHRLIARAWVDNEKEDEFKDIDHIDRDPFNNHYTNLRWICRVGNIKNRNNSLWVNYYGFTVYLKDLISNLYPDDSGAYGWFYSRGDLRNIDVSTLLGQYRTRNDLVDELVEYHGVERSLRELCVEYGSDYNNTVKLIREGCTLYYALANQYKTFHSIEVKSRTGSIIYFNNREMLYGSLRQHISVARVPEMLREGWLYEDMRDYEHISKQQLLFINGEGKTRDEWVRHYETTRDRVRTNMSKYGVTFEEALVMPVLRVKFLIVNGVRMKVKEFWESLGLNAKVTNDTKSKLKLSFTQTLRHFGIDDNKYNLEVV